MQFRLAEANAAASAEIAGHPLRDYAIWLGQAALYALILIGVALRARQFLFNRAMWLDEALLAVNVVNKNFSELLTKPLDFSQSAPPGFLVATHALGAAAGFDDWILRIVPFTAGLLLAPLSFVLARRELRSLPARITFVGLIALSPLLIYYASEFKQYSSDALAAIGILVALSYRHARYGPWLLAAVGCLALLFSMPAMFVLIAAGLLILYEGYAARRWGQIIAIGFGWSIGAGLHALYLWQAGVSRDLMVGWWAKEGGFAPFPLSTAADYLWYPSSLATLAYRPLTLAGIFTPGFDTLPWTKPLLWFLALALIAAAIAALWRPRAICTVAIGAILLTLLASVFEIYPFSSRLLIFLVPLVFFILATGIDRLQSVAPFFATVMAIALLAVPFPHAMEFVQRPVVISDMRDALDEVAKNRRAGDVIAVWQPSYAIYQFYSPKLGHPAAPQLLVSRQDDAHSLVEQAGREGYRRMWFVAAHRMNEAEDLIYQISGIVPVAFEWTAPRTRVLLFDLTSPAQHPQTEKSE